MLTLSAGTLLAACAQQAVNDKVDAVVTGYTSFGSNIVPILKAADIPFIGNPASSNAELNHGW